MHSQHRAKKNNPATHAVAQHYTQTTQTTSDGNNNTITQQ